MEDPAADLVAKRQKVDWSALIRQALQEHLKRQHALALGEQDRRRYTTRPQENNDARIWEDAAIWPEG